MTKKVWKQFNHNVLTHSTAHYLMAINSLIDDQGYARLVDIAKKLDISKGSLSVSLKPLVEKKLIIEDENKHFWLSDAGKTYALAIENAHNVLKDFFLNVLHVSAEEAEVDACKAEHLLSETIIKKISLLQKELMKHPDILKKV